jgi:hypothetical protein
MILTPQSTEEEKCDCNNSLLLSPQCDKHTNHIDHDDTNDMQRKTRSQTISSNNDSTQKWKGISATTKRVTKLQHAITSPMKMKQKNYNLYSVSSGLKSLAPNAS